MIRTDELLIIVNKQQTTKGKKEERENASTSTTTHTGLIIVLTERADGPLWRPEIQSKRAGETALATCGSQWRILWRHVS